MPKNYKTGKFDKGPQVAVSFRWREDGTLLSSHLTLSDAFSYSQADPFLLDWLEAYLQGNSLPVPLISGSTFTEKALRALQTIPFGETISYAALAHLAGKPKAAQAAGYACHRNPFPLLIPCHRVVKKDGNLGGFALDLRIKERLLAFERQVI